MRAEEPPAPRYLSPSRPPAGAAAHLSAGDEAPPRLSPERAAPGSGGILLPLTPSGAGDCHTPQPRHEAGRGAGGRRGAAGCGGGAASPPLGADGSAVGVPAAGAGGRHRGRVSGLRQRGGAGAAESQNQVTGSGADRAPPPHRQPLLPRCARAALRAAGRALTQRPAAPQHRHTAAFCCLEPKGPQPEAVTR